MVSSDDREAWLRERMRYVTASDAAALLGLSEYKTREQLRMEKLGLTELWAGSEGTNLALQLEGPALDIAARRYGWNIVRNTSLIEDPWCDRLAATPDAFLHAPWGSGVVQVKWTNCVAQEDCKPKKNGEPSTAAYSSGPPLHYVVQVQAEMACTDLVHGCLLVMHTTPALKLRPYYIPRDPCMVERIRRETEAFWKEIEACQTV